MGLAEELDGAIGRVLTEQPMALRAHTEGPQHLDAEQAVAFEKVLVLRAELVDAARRYDALMPPGG